MDNKHSQVLLALLAVESARQGLTVSTGSRTDHEGEQAGKTLRYVTIGYWEDKE